MKLYHGSNQEIIVPDIALSKPMKDFGQGFYLSGDFPQAEKFAKQKYEQLQQGEPFVSVFEFDENSLSNGRLNVKIFPEYSIEWAKFVLDNRTNKNFTHTFDIVYGPIADDGVTFQLRRHTAGAITLEALVEELKYEKGITFQYFFGTEKALSLLRKV